MKNKYKGFTEMSNQEKNEISAGAAIGATIASVVSGVTSGLSNIVNIADDISNTIIKNKIVSKIDETEKGEISLSKDGEIKLKWDDTSSPLTKGNSTVIF